MPKVVSIMVRYFFREIASKLGLLLIFGALGFACLKAWETITYVPAQATVTAEQIRCEMSYRFGGRTIHETTVPCERVAGVKAQSPDTTWIVSPKSYLTIAFVTAKGERVAVTLPRGKLESATVAPGETIAILYSPSKPTVVGAPVDVGLAAMLGGTLLVGIVLQLLSRRLRAVAAADGTADGEPALPSPIVQPEPRRPFGGPGAASAPIAKGQPTSVVEHGHGGPRQVGTVSR